MRLDAQRLGESALIDRIAQQTRDLSPLAYITVVEGIGDDAAVLQAGGQTILWTADMLIEGVHFRLDWIDARSLGWKSLAVNLSDIAAMGGEPIGALLSMALPPDHTADWLGELMAGFTECARAYRTPLLGGDTNRAERVVIDVSVLGVVSGSPLLRRGAQAGDLILVSGALGGSRAGLEALQAGKGELVDLTPHFRPTPRLEVGSLARTLGATAMMDLSDGLAADLPKLLRAANKGAIIRRAAIPVHDAALRWAQTRDLDPALFAIAGGEDYELLMTVPPANTPILLEQIPQQTGVPLTVIGEVIEAPELWLESPDGQRESFAITGWDHFAV